MDLKRLPGGSTLGTPNPFRRIVTNRQPRCMKFSGFGGIGEAMSKANNYKQLKEAFMKDLIIEQIQRRARVEHGGDFNKAAAEYFRDHPEYYAEYTEAVIGVNKRANEDREKVIAAGNYRIEWVAAATNWISPSRPSSRQHRRKSSPRIQICISAT
jgi:hypothetical protein